MSTEMAGSDEPGPDEERRPLAEFALRQAAAMLASQEASLEATRRQVAMILSVGALQAALFGTMTGDTVSTGEKWAAALLLLGFAVLVWRAIVTWRPRGDFHFQASHRDIQKMLSDLDTGVSVSDLLINAGASMESWHDENEERHLKGLRSGLYWSYGALVAQTVAVLLAAIN